MIEFENGGRLVESTSELPDLRNAKQLYVDFETTSGDPKLNSLNPWHHCAIAGIAITAGDHSNAWYVPIRHNDSRWNLPIEPVLEWLAVTLETCEDWINQNVKYDATCAARDGILFGGRLVCTLTLAKIIDSDRVTRGGYSLSALSKGWLDRDIDAYEDRVKAYLAGCGSRGSKDYGDVPADILGDYACQDVFTARRLYAYEVERCPEQCNEVWETEIKLTPCLFDMEMEGMRIDVQEVQKTQLVTLNRMMLLEEDLHDRIGFAIRPHVNADCFELLCNKYGMEVLGWTDEGNPSFDKDALKAYLRHPIVVESEKLTGIVEKMLAYRKLNTLNSLFLETFLKLHVDGVLHPDYNQAVRTARLSCRRPNMQQQTDESKALIHPGDGYWFISGDYSQIEFRFIVHYIEDATCIAAYLANADTDFHQWVAEMCMIPRPPAKNINFAIGFGGGRNRVLKMLTASMELVGHLMKQVNELVKAGAIEENERLSTFQAFARRHAEKVYRKYHATLPGIKKTSRRAEAACKRRGYVHNHYGRHRHLPANAAWLAFNNLAQSSAADLMKERTVATSPRFNERIRSWKIKQSASVHDEVLFRVPSEVAQDPECSRYIADTMETVSRPIRVPIRVAIGKSPSSWAEASKTAAVLT